MKPDAKQQNNSVRSQKQLRPLSPPNPSPIDDNKMRRSYILTDTSLLQQKIQECEGLRDRNERLSRVNKEIQEINQALQKQIEDIKRNSQDRQTFDSESEVQTLKLLLLERENEIQNYKIQNSDMQQYSSIGAIRQTSPHQRESYEVLLNEKDYEIEMLTNELQKLAQRERFATQQTEPNSRQFLSQSTRAQNNEADALRRDNKTLQIYLNDLENKLEEMKQIILQKEDQLLSFGCKLAQKEQSLRHYDKILQDTKHKEDYLEKKVTILSEELERLDQAMRSELGEKYENELRSYEERLQILEQESKATLKMSHTKMQHELNMLSDEISSRDIRISQLEYEGVMKDEEIEVMAQQIKKLESYIKVQSKQKEARNVLDQTIKEKITLENEVADLQQKANQLEQEKDIILEQCQNVREMADIEQRNNTNLTDQINTSKKEIQYLRAQTIDRERQMLIKDKIIKDKSLDIKKLQEQVQELLIQVEKLNEVQQDNQSLVHQIDSLYEELQLTKDSSTQVLTDLDAQKSNEIAKLKDLIKQFEKKMIEAEQIKQELDQANNKIIDLLQQIDQKDHDAQEKLAQQQENESQLKQEIDNLNEDVKAYQDLEQQNKQQGVNLVEAQKKIGELQRSEKSNADKLNKLDLQLTNSKENLQKSDLLNKQLREQIKEQEKILKDQEKILKGKNDEDLKKANAVEKQIKALSNQIEKLTQQTADLTKEITLRDEDKKSKQLELSENKKKQDQEKKLAQEQINKLNKDLDKELKDKEKLNQVIKTLEANQKEPEKKETQDPTQSLELKDKELQQKNAQIKKLQDSLKDKEKGLQQLNKISKENEDMLKTIQQLQEKIDKNEQEQQIVQLQNELNDLKNKQKLVDNEDKQVKQKDSQIKKLQEQIKEKDKLLQSKTQTFNDLQKEYVDLNKYTDELEASIAENKDPQVALIAKNEQIATLEQKLADINGKVEKLIKENQVLDKKLKDQIQKSPLKSALKSPSSSPEKVQDQEKQLKDLKNQLDLQTQKLKPLLDQVKELERINKEKDGFLAEWEAAYDKIENENKQLQNDLKNSSKSPKKGVGTDNQLENLTKQVADLKEQQKAGEAMKSKLESQVKPLSDQVKKLEAEKKEKDDLLKEWDVAYDKLENENKKLQTDLKTLSTPKKGSTDTQDPQIKPLLDQVKELERINKEKDEFLTEWEVAYDKLEKENKKLADQSQDALAKLKQSQLQANDSNQKLQQSQAKVKESEKKAPLQNQKLADDLNSKLAEQDKLIALKDQEIQKLNKDLKLVPNQEKLQKQKETQIKQLQDQVQQLQDKLKDSVQQMQDKLKEAQTANQKIQQKLKDENLDLKKQQKEVNQSLKEQEKKLSSNKKDLEEADLIKQKLEDTQAELDKNIADNQKIQDKYNDIKKKCDEQEKQLEKQKEELQQIPPLKQANQKLQDEMIMQQQKVVDLESIVIERDTELDELIRQLKNMQREIEGAFQIETELKLQINEYARLKLDSNDLEAALKDQIESLSGLLREKDQQLNKSQREITDLSKKVRANPNQDLLMRTKEQQLKDFQSQQSDKDRIIAQMERQLTDQEQDIKYLRQVLDESIYNEKKAQITIDGLQEKQQEYEILEKVVEQKNKQLILQQSQMQESLLVEHQIELNDLMKQLQVQSDDIDKLSTEKKQLQEVIASLGEQKKKMENSPLVQNRSSKDIRQSSVH